jgi:hypothetical protein
MIKIERVELAFRRAECELRKTGNITDHAAALALKLLADDLVPRPSSDLRREAAVGREAILMDLAAGIREAVGDG